MWDRAKWYVGGLVLVIWSSRVGVDSAELGTERNVKLRDWYWLLVAAVSGVIQQIAGQSETVCCGTGTGYVSSRGGGVSAELGTERNGMLRDWYWVMKAVVGGRGLL